MANETGEEKTKDGEGSTDNSFLQPDDFDTFLEEQFEKNKEITLQKTIEEEARTWENDYHLGDRTIASEAGMWEKEHHLGKSVDALIAEESLSDDERAYITFKKELPDAIERAYQTVFPAEDEHKNERKAFVLKIIQHRDQRVYVFEPENVRLEIRVKQYESGLSSRGENKQQDPNPEDTLDYHVSCAVLAMTEALDTKDEKEHAKLFIKAREELLHINNLPLAKSIEDIYNILKEYEKTP